MGKRIVSRRRGAGSIYRAPSHKYKAAVRYPSLKSSIGKVKDIVHDPARTTPLLKVDFEGSTFFLPAPESLKQNQTITLGKTASIAIGNILPLGSIPEGTRIFNLEVKPGDGGRLVRAAGTSAIVVTQGEKTIVQLPSGKMKAFSPFCRATIGIVAGSGRPEKPWGKAGKKYLALRAKAAIYPRVSGVAMNPVAHPHGGGSHQHVGRPSTVSSSFPPGKKTGSISPKRTGRKKI
jgi:large subunit ribosomal protein L2